MAEDNKGLSNSPMLSFPSTFDSGGDGLVLRGADNSQSEKFRRVASERSNFSSAIERIKTRNLSIRDVRAHYYTENAINISKYSSILPVISLGDNGVPQQENMYFEDPYHFPSDILREMNMYKFMYKKSTTGLMGVSQDNDKKTYYTTETAMAPSLFNPKFNVQVIGMTYNVPLLNDHTNRGMYAIDKDVTDCSVRKLIELSNNDMMGQQKYRLTDFIFCKDYGKVSNNHLITLRKFALPIGDIIGAPASPKYSTRNSGDITGVDNMDDVAHLVTWFGTEDNKLEEIIKYSYQYTWKEIKSEYTPIDSKQDAPERGIIGMFANMNMSFSKNVEQGIANSGATLLGKFGGTISNAVSQDELERLRFVDDNKVYSPLQTIQDTHIPEGKLVFTNEFTLTFSYKLRAYENINPKSAFLDLLANIHECTYFRGKYWKGRRPIVGPQPNHAAYKTAYQFIDNAFEAMGGAMKSIINGEFNNEEIMGALSSCIPKSISNAASNFMNNVKENGIGSALSEGFKQLSEAVSGAGIVQVLKGQLKTKLGRPAFYAMKSMIEGGDTGLWHVTIGNPRNPIVSMGNLIMTNAQVQHMGPLGLDDFPTELKVTCTLKPAMSRDLVGIQKMYTQGINSIYYTKEYDKLETQLMFNFGGGLDAPVGASDEAKLAHHEQVDQQMATQQLNMQNKDDSIQSSYDSWGKVNSDLGMMIASTGTSNMFKLQLSNDQILPSSV